MTLIKYLIAFLLINFDLHAQDSLSHIQELQQLLKQRKTQFESYAIAADKRSGIFRNQTKKDLLQSREILLDIVNVDNRIMDELDRAISARGMAKADYSVDEMRYQQTIQQLTFAADTLEKQLTATKEVSASLQKKTTLQQWALYFLVGLILLGILRRFISSKGRTGIENPQH